MEWEGLAVINRAPEAAHLAALIPAVANPVKEVKPGNLDNRAPAGLLPDKAAAPALRPAAKRVRRAEAVQWGLAPAPQPKPAR